MLEFIKFGDCKVKTIQIGNEWLINVRHTGIAIGVSSDTLKIIVLIIYIQSISFHEGKLVLIALMMAPICSLQCLGSAESY